MSSRKKAAHTVAAAAGIGLAAILSGCATDAGSAESSSGTDQATPSASTPATSTPATGQDATGATGATAYVDGKYTGQGSYTSPAGPEKVTIQVTLASDKVTDVTFSSDATSPTTKIYQGKFVSGLDGAVVGKSLDDISIDKLAGSSLTGGGFNEAIDQIKGEARG